jgi:hypothetical protein
VLPKGYSCSGLGFVGQSLYLKALSGVTKEEGPAKLVAAEGKRKKACKVVKERRSQVKMVLGEDIRVEQTIEYFGKDLIGKFHGWHISDHNFSGWMQRSVFLCWGMGWSSHLMVRGWIGIIFCSEDDVHKILKGCWYRGFAYLVLNVSTLGLRLLSRFWYG